MITRFLPKEMGREIQYIPNYRDSKMHSFCSIIVSGITLYG